MSATTRPAVPATPPAETAVTPGAHPCRCQEPPETPDESCCRGEVCCHLDCIERPRFYCGQLLTDDDLGDLVGWTREKLALARYRQGWGVVCGLRVRCDPRRPAGVLVAPGYAVSCCGDDVVVCRETPVDLAAACRPGVPPCADPSFDAAAGGDGGDEKILVDLELHYREEAAELRAALG
ncbi:MAG: hypothetical protein GWN71_41855, partial [Gammaproteobacteria bacterium]|nr:hypothetical protein [Gemmatimonadota bacterium]NIU79855.1 hypothetical protein [Gammaproteobacteria bacterium]